MNKPVLQVGLIIVGMSFIASTASAAVSWSRDVNFAPGVGAVGYVNSQSPASDGPLIFRLSNTARLFEGGVNVDTQSKTCTRGVSGSGFLPINCTATAQYNYLAEACTYCIDGFVFVITTPLGGDDFTVEVPERCKAYTPPSGGGPIEWP
jgi:hypothetical protein